MHNDWIRPDGLWPPETVLTGGDLRRFDSAQFQAVNGDAGGTWVPLTPITIGGASLVLTGGTTGHVIKGGVLTLTGGRVKLGASIYPSFSVDVSRTIQWPLFARGFVSLNPIGTLFSQTGVDLLPVPIPGRQLHRGAILASANVTIAIGQKHQAVPRMMPRVMLVRSDYVPIILEPWTASTGYQPGNIVEPFPPNGYLYSATNASASGFTQPTWPNTINSQVTDTGGVTWVCIGYAGYVIDGWSVFGQPPIWAALTAYTANEIVAPLAGNGLTYVCTVSGTSGAAQPTWPQAYGSTVTDGGATWTCLGPAPAPAFWNPDLLYRVGTYVRAVPANGMYYVNMSTGTSGFTPPVFPTTIGASVGEGPGGPVWQCVGSLPLGAGSLTTPTDPDAYFNGGAPQTLSVPCANFPPIDTANYSYSLFLLDERGYGAFQSVEAPLWQPSTSYVYTAPFLQLYVQPNPVTGLYYAALLGGTSGSTPPVWPTAVGSTVSDGSVTWICVGPAGPSNNLFMSVAFSLETISDMRPE